MEQVFLAHFGIRDLNFSFHKKNWPHLLDLSLNKTIRKKENIFIDM